MNKEEKEYIENDLETTYKIACETELYDLLRYCKYRINQLEQHKRLYFLKPFYWWCKGKILAYYHVYYRIQGFLERNRK